MSRVYKYKHAYVCVSKGMLVFPPLFFEYDTLLISLKCIITLKIAILQIYIFIYFSPIKRKYNRKMSKVALKTHNTNLFNLYLCLLVKTGCLSK